MINKFCYNLVFLILICLFLAFTSSCSVFQESSWQQQKEFIDGALDSIGHNSAVVYCYASPSNNSLNTSLNIHCMLIDDDDNTIDLLYSDNNVSGSFSKIPNSGFDKNYSTQDKIDMRNRFNNITISPREAVETVLDDKQNSTKNLKLSRIETVLFEDLVKQFNGDPIWDVIFIDTENNERHFFVNALDGRIEIIN